MLPAAKKRAAPARRRVVLGLDPSICAYGWSILAIGDPGQRDTVIAAGCIATAVDDADAYVFEQDGERIDDLTRALLQILHAASLHGDVWICFEVPGGSKSSRAAKMLAYAYAMTRAVIVARSAPSVPLPARVVKLELTGDPEAEKPTVADCVEKAIGWRPKASTKVESEAQSDATAVAIVGRRRLWGRA